MLLTDVACLDDITRCCVRAVGHLVQTFIHVSGIVYTFAFSNDPAFWVVGFIWNAYAVFYIWVRRLFLRKNGFKSEFAAIACLPPLLTFCSRSAQARDPERLKPPFVFESNFKVRGGACSSSYLFFFVINRIDSSFFFFFFLSPLNSFRVAFEADLHCAMRVWQAEGPRRRVLHIGAAALLYLVVRRIKCSLPRCLRGSVGLLVSIE